MNRQPDAPALPDRLAVVISTYNKPAYLRLVLEGYRRQTDHAFSIYIADDGSSDETRKLIEDARRSFPVTIEHVWHEDRGFRKARVHNLALRRIREPYVLLTDGDCIPLPGLVATHRRLARPGMFISGSRILLSEHWTRHLFSGKQLDADMTAWHWLSHRLRGDINRFLPLLAHPHLSAPTDQLAGIRGCHLSCPLEALLRVNGFDESYQGWGREDSDLVARLLHAGIRRRNLRGMPVLHLWHEEHSRHRLETNDRLLQDCLETRRIEAIRGLRQLEEYADE